MQVICGKVRTKVSTVSENRAILHQAVLQESPLTGHNVGPREENLTVGIDYLSWDRRLAGVCVVGEKSEDEEAEQRNQKYGLNPTFGQKKTAFSRRVHAIDSYGAVRPLCAGPHRGSIP
jgi:hypothetical protein